MTSLELLQEIDAWLSFNNSPSKEQISGLRNDIKKHISEQLNILHVSNSVCPKCGNTGRCEPRTLSDPDGQECDCGANCC